MHTLVTLCRFATICTIALAVLPVRAQNTPPSSALYQSIATEVDANLQKDVLGKWFPAAIDNEHGGFYQNFSEDWTRKDPDDKAIVYQSRLTWTAAQAARRDPQQAAAYLSYARHGLQFLKDKLWDKQDGGLYWATDADGNTSTDRHGEKHAYGISFAIYAAAGVSQAAHDPEALDLAKRAFVWLDTHAHDAKYGGYYEAFTREGTPILTPPTTPGAGTSDSIGTRYGYKSMNTHIHLLESLTALYEIWPDPTVHSRLQEVFGLVRDKIATDPGCLHLFFFPDWRPVPDGDSFGHDVETAFLLTESAAVLGKPNDAKTWTVARQLVDHALDFGEDTVNGGFYDRGSAFEPATGKDKIWWTQGEALNALLLMHERYGKTTPRYWDAFMRQWKFIKTKQIDPVHGGWYPTVNPDGSPIPGHGKSDGWTESYHQGRALMNVSDRLRHLAGAGVN